MSVLALITISIYAMAELRRPRQNPSTQRTTQVRSFMVGQPVPTEMTPEKNIDATGFLVPVLNIYLDNAAYAAGPYSELWIDVTVRNQSYGSFQHFDYAVTADRNPPVTYTTATSDTFTIKYFYANPNGGGPSGYPQYHQYLWIRVNSGEQSQPLFVTAHQQGYDNVMAPDLGYTGWESAINAPVIPNLLNRRYSEKANHSSNFQPVDIKWRPSDKVVGGAEYAEVMLSIPKIKDKHDGVLKIGCDTNQELVDLILERNLHFDKVRFESFKVKD